MVKINCKYCKKVFFKKVGNQEYCSINCRQRNYYKNNRKHLIESCGEWQKKEIKTRGLPLRLRALKAWKTRREEEIIPNKIELLRLNKEIKLLE